MEENQNGQNNELMVTSTKEELFAKIQKIIIYRFIQLINRRF